MSSKSVSKPGPLAGKRFFIDPKVDKSTSNKVKQKLIALGGKVEEFLDKGIHFALTSEAIVGRTSKDGVKCRSSSQSPFSTTSPAVEQSSAVGLRWKRLAKQAGCKVQSSSIVDVAKSFGIKIRFIDDVLTWLNKKTETLNTTATGRSIPPHQPNDIRLKDPCVKIEDLKRSIKPIYEEFESFSHLDLSVKGTKCPFVNTISPVKTKPNATKRPEKKGFCECCQCSYLNEKKHRKTTEHLSFGETVSHFENLDQYIASQNLSLGSFVSHYQSTVKKESALEDPPKIGLKGTEEVDKELEDYTSQSSSLKSPDCHSAGNSVPAAGTPRRRSPRKSVINDSPILKKRSTISRTRESKRLNFESKDLASVSTLPMDCDGSTKSKSSPSKNTSSQHRITFDLNRDDAFRLDNIPNRFRFSPTVTLEELPINSFKRKRIQSCDALATPLTDTLSNSPLSRLRSSKRKAQESPKSLTTPKRDRLVAESDIPPSSDDLLSLLKSSKGDIPFRNEFLGF